MNLSLLLRMAAEGMADRPCLGPRGGTLTYSEVLDRASRTASWIARRSVDHVAFLGVNSELTPALLFGTAIAGRRYVALNYRLADDRLATLIERLAPVVVIADDVAAERARVDGAEVFCRTKAEDEIARAAPADQDSEDTDDVAVVLFTSGTTGEPKPAILRHRHLVSYIISTVEFMSAEEGEAALVSVPPYHVAGVAAILSSVYAGRRIVYAPSFDPAGWIRTVASEGVTHAMLVPTMLARVLEVLEGQPLPTLRHLAYGGGRMPLPVIERALEALPNVDFVNAYGLTETTSTVCLLGPEDHRLAHHAEDPAMRRRLGSVGRPLEGIQLEVRGPDGRPMAMEQAGEVWLRGEQVAGEYVGAGPGDTGWFRTGDMGWVDQDGFLYLEGRADDVIVRGGENLSPGEIEDVLITHPAVADAAVIGVADDEWGQVPIAFVVPAPGSTPVEAELRDLVRDRLRSSRMPARVLFVDVLPHSETGKLLRRELRDRLDVQR